MRKSTIHPHFIWV